MLETDEISFEAQFCQNQTKTTLRLKFEKLLEIFDEFSISYRHISSKSYMNKHSRLLNLGSLRILGGLYGF